MTFDASWVTGLLSILWLAPYCVTAFDFNVLNPPTDLKVSGYDDTTGKLALSWRAPTFSSSSPADGNYVISEYRVTDRATTGAVTYVRGIPEAPTHLAVSTSERGSLFSDYENGVQEFKFDIDAQRSTGVYSESSESITCTVVKGRVWGDDDEWAVKLSGVLRVGVDEDGAYPTVADVTALADALHQELGDDGSMSMFIKPMVPTDKFFEAEFQVRATRNVYVPGSTIGDGYIMTAMKLIGTIGDGALANTLRGQTEYFANTVGVIELLSGYGFEEPDGASHELLTEIGQRLFSVGVEKFEWEGANSFCQGIMGDDWELAFGASPSDLQLLMQDKDEPRWFGNHNGGKGLCESAKAGTGEVEKVLCRGAKYAPICGLKFPPGCTYPFPANGVNDQDPLCGEEWNLRVHGVLEVSMMDMDEMPGPEQADAIGRILAETVEYFSDYGMDGNFQRLRAVASINPMLITSPRHFEVEFYLASDAEEHNWRERKAFFEGINSLVRTGELAWALATHQQPLLGLAAEGPSEEESFFLNRVTDVKMLPGFELMNKGVTTQLLTEIEGDRYFVGPEKLTCQEAESFCEAMLGGNWAMAFGTAPHVLKQLMEGAEEPRWFGRTGRREWWRRGASGLCRSAEVGTGEWVTSVDDRDTKYQPICREFQDWESVVTRRTNAAEDEKKTAVTETVLLIGCALAVAMIVAGVVTFRRLKRRAGDLKDLLEEASSAA